MRAVPGLFNKPAFLLLLAFAMALMPGTPAVYLRHVILPIVVAVMTFSAASIRLSDLVPLSKIVKPGLAGIACHYAVMSVLILLIARFLVHDHDLWLGFVMVAASPPGVAVVPFTYILGGRVALSALGTFAAFAASLLFAPAITFLFIGQSLVTPGQMAAVLVKLIVAPFLLSRLFFIVPRLDRVLAFRGPVINWGMFFVILTSVGLNRDTFFAHPGIVLETALTAVLCIFGVSLAVEWILKRTRIPGEDRISYILMSTIKNGAFATVTALTLIGEKASASASIFSSFTALYLVYLTIRNKRKPV
jgi:BASS family bile acid:Na+ symporter